MQDLQTITIDKLVPGGQGLGTLSSGKKVFVWGVLPGEQIEVEPLRSKKRYAEGRLIRVVKPSCNRVEPKDTTYLATSPWQIMDIATEDKFKKQLLQESFEFEKVDIPTVDFLDSKQEYGYRNKMEYSFFGDEDGLHLAMFGRGSHFKIIVDGSTLAMPCLDKAARAVLAELNRLQVRASDLKSVVVRCNQGGQVVAALFTKLQKPLEVAMPKELVGLRIYHSNPKSPASVPTSILSEQGQCILQDELLGKTLKYDVAGFFQVNMEVFLQALASIGKLVNGKPSIDMYCGVGSIGLCVGADTLVEVDSACAAMAKDNAGPGVEVVHARVEDAVQYITKDKLVIVDPPRSGLHKDVIDRLLTNGPSTVVYLSCNPSTQARDCKALSTAYKLSSLTGYNFFPHTPHIESLVVLSRLI